MVEQLLCQGILVVATAATIAFPRQSDGTNRIHITTTAP